MRQGDSRATLEAVRSSGWQRTPQGLTSLGPLPLSVVLSKGGKVGWVSGPQLELGGERVDLAGDPLELQQALPGAVVAEHLTGPEGRTAIVCPRLHLRVDVVYTREGCWAEYALGESPLLERLRPAPGI